MNQLITLMLGRGEDLPGRAIERARRSGKPFGVMTPTIADARSFAQLHPDVPTRAVIQGPEPEWLTYVFIDAQRMKLRHLLWSAGRSIDKAASLIVTGNPTTRAHAWLLKLKEMEGCLVEEVQA